MHSFLLFFHTIPSEFISIQIFSVFNIWKIMFDSSVVAIVDNITFKLFNKALTNVLTFLKKKERKFSFLTILHRTNNFIFIFLFINMKNYFQMAMKYTLCELLTKWKKKTKRKLFNEMKNFSNWKWKIVFVYFFHCFRNSTLYTRKVALSCAINDG